MSIILETHKKIVICNYQRLVLHEHWCLGCKDIHRISVEQPFTNGAQWSFDGNFDKPTFKPSINICASYSKQQCHYFIREGNIQFCGDCHHDLAGKTVPLPDIPEGHYD